MRWLTPLSLLLAACSANPRFGVPSEVSEGDTLVFFVAVEGFDPVVYAAEVNGEDVVIPIDLEAGQTVETELAVYDDRRLEELQLSPGLTELSAEGAPLPAPDAHYAQTVDGPPGGAAFAPIAWSGSRLAEARFDRSPAACLAAKRCLTEDGLCIDCTGPESISAPEPPEPPKLDCPPGWAEATLRSDAPAIRLCDPRIDVPRLSCPPGERRALGERECTAVGRACPTSGRYAEGVAGLHVDPMAAAGGDGSLAAPFSTLPDALDVAAPGTTILLSIGTHTSSGYTFDRLGTDAMPVTLRGACASQTTIAIDNGFGNTSSYARFEDVRIEAGVALWTGTGGRFVLEGADLRVDSPLTAIQVDDGDIEVRDVVAELRGGLVRGTNGAVIVNDVVAHGTFGRIIDTTGGTRTEVTDSVLIEGERGQPLVWTYAVDEVLVQRVAFEEAQWTAVHVDGGTLASIEDVYYRTVTGIRFPAVYAFAVHRIAAQLSGLWIEGAQGLLHYDARVEIEDVVVHPDGSGQSERRPPAIFFSDDAVGRLVRTVVYEAHHKAIWMQLSNVDLEDVRIEGVRAEQDVVYNDELDGVSAVVLFGEPDIRITRLAIRDVEGPAIVQRSTIASIGRELEFTDIDVQASGPIDCYTSVGGFLAGVTGYRLTRARFVDIRGAAIALDIPAVAGVPSYGAIRADDLAVAGVVTIPGCPRVTAAVEVGEGGELDLRNFDIGASDGPGIEVRPNTLNAVDATMLDASNGYIHDVPIGIRYRVTEPRLEALVGVRIEPNAGGTAIDLGGI